MVHSAKYGLQDFCQACFHGDLPLVEAMLDQEDPVSGFQGDINMHQADYNALHLAAANGMLEVVEALLAAGADPHMKTRVPAGKDPEEGKTAREIADEWGWDDIADALKTSEGKVEKGDYVMYGCMNNAKIYPSTAPGGRDPAQVKKAAERLQALRKPYFLREGEKPVGASLLFPGQGSQCVKMLENTKNLAAVKEMAKTAKSVLGFDVLEVCEKGPASKLEDPKVGLPAVFFADLAAPEKLKGEKPDVASSPGAVAGFGVGELAALVAAGVMSFETGLKVCKARADALEAASSKSKDSQAMLSVAGVRVAKLEELCKEVAAETKSVCEVANVLFPKGATCAGTKDAMQKLEKKVKSAGAVQAKLHASSGAVNTSMMASAKEKVEEALRDAAGDMSPPTCTVYMNRGGVKVAAGSSVKGTIIPNLVNGIAETLQWEACVRKMIKSGSDEFYEVGPMKQLKNIMKRIDAGMYERTENIEA